MSEQNRNTSLSLRLKALLAVMVLLLVGGATHKGRVWYYERQLRQLGHEIVQTANEEDPLPLPAEGPEADVEIRTTCVFENIFYGPKKGKVTLLIRPRPHADPMLIGGITYEYIHRNGQWSVTESYHE